MRKLIGAIKLCAQTDEKIQIDLFRQPLFILQLEWVKLDQATIGRLTRMDAMRAQSMAIETIERCKVSE